MKNAGFSRSCLMVLFLSFAGARADSFSDISRNQILDALMTGEHMNASLDERSRLRVGTLVLYRTSAARYGKLEVQAFPDIQIRWLTYSNDGSTFSSGEGLRIRDSYIYDLDTGTELESIGPEVDIWLQNEDSVTRSLVPWNGTRMGIPTTSVISFPQLADGGGIRSELLLANSGPESSTGILYILGSGGEPSIWSVGGVWHEAVEYDLPPGGVLRLMTDGLGGIKVGHALLCPDNAYPSISGTIVYLIGTHEVSVAPTVAGSRFQVFVQRGQSVDSGMAVSNPGARGLVVDVTLLDRAGKTLDVSEILLPRRGQQAKFLSELFDSVPADFEGSILLRSSGVFTVLGLRQKAGGAIVLLPAAVASFEIPD